MGQYLPLVLLIALVVVFVVGSWAIMLVLGPRRPTVAKELPYECGIVPHREPPARFPVRFYLVAMIFVILDIEIIFVYPYVTNYRALGAFGLIEIVVFSIAVFVALIYMVANGALDWGPVQRFAKSDPRRSAQRTASTTVRRVGGAVRVPVQQPVRVARDDTEQLPEKEEVTV